MVQQSVLLQIIQFVGLITPALAILIELLVRFHGGLPGLASDKDLPVEIQILFIGFSAILFGGMVIGVQFGLTLDDPVTQSATLAIFGGLPFLALSLILVNIRISNISRPDTTMTDDLILAIRVSSSVAIPLLLSAILYFGMFNYFRQLIHSKVSWWIFNGGIDPIWYFYSLSAMLVYKTLYSLWRQNRIPTIRLGEVLGNWLGITLVISIFLAITVGLPFVVYYILLIFDIPFISQASFTSSMPYLWGGAMALALVSIDVNLDDD